MRAVRSPTENAELSDGRVEADVVGRRAVVSRRLVALRQRLEAHVARRRVHLHSARSDDRHAALPHRRTTTQSHIADFASPPPLNTYYGRRAFSVASKLKLVLDLATLEGCKKLS